MKKLFKKGVAFTLSLALSMTVLFPALSKEAVKTAEAADTSAFDDLSASEIATAMGAGINLGNTLDAHNNQTPDWNSWGNPAPAASNNWYSDYFKTISEAGFKTVRIPITWGTKIGSDSNYTIDSTYLNNVKNVVDAALEYDLFVIINTHHDDVWHDGGTGWLNPTSSDQTAICNKFSSIWTQIATTFKDYDEHLIFESMNEVYGSSDWSSGKERPQADHYANINTYNQRFLDAVRKTGGNNTKRWVLVPGWNTNIELTTGDYGFVIPTDTYKDSSITTPRIMISVHYYEPWEFCGSNVTNYGEGWRNPPLDTTQITMWGNEATDSSAVCDWGDETYMESSFAKLTTFTNNNYPVIVGEYGSILKNTTIGDTYRAYYTKKLCTLSKNNGLIVPIIWDTGNSSALKDDISGENNFQLVAKKDNSWNTGFSITHPDLLNAIMDVYGDGSSSGGNSGNAASLDAAEVIWSGSKTCNWDSITFPSSVLDNYINPTITVNFTAGSSNNWTCVQFMTQGWRDDDEGKFSYSLPTTATTCSLDLTNHIDEVKANGLIFQGYNLTVTSITLSGLKKYTLYTQTTAVENSKYSQRWVMLVPDEDLATLNSGTLVITRTNDNKKMTVTLTKYYNSVSAAGATITAPDGYKFVAFALLNIPEDVTLSANTITFS
ncbi:MAG: glycoside hydrolase family 5 protein [Lachnospiraceae bacterium]|nr:glycoside hydrolase family 5 protein [Lachnospiraceae bacterium]